MFGIDSLLRNVMLLAVMVLIGVILKKAGKADGNLAKGFADIVVYLSQPAMIIYSFVSVKFDGKVLSTAVLVLVFSFLFHLLYYAVSLLFFRTAPEKQKIVLRFSMIFTNAGFLGIPLISNLLGNEAAIYATFYVVSFNAYCWSLGCYIYTGDRKYISVKKMLWNPATVPTYIGLFFFILSAFVTVPEAVQPAFDRFIVPFIRDHVLLMLKETVIPLSMMMVGIRLADCNVKSLLHDRYMPVNLVVRLVVIPLAVMLIMRGIALMNLFDYDILRIVSLVLVICAATPTAAMTSIFAEKFDGDPVYAGKIVSASTMVSLITMPLVTALLNVVF